MLKSAVSFLPVAIAALLAAGCGDVTGPSIAVPDVRPYVTGNAAAALDERGHFRDDLFLPPRQDSVLQAARAARLALGYVTAFYAGRTGTFPERTHGRAIPWGSLSEDDRRPAHFVLAT